MAALNTLYDFVRRKCPGVVDLMVDDALVKVYREFCLRSEYLVENRQFTNVVLNDVLTLLPSSNHYVLKVVKVVRTEGTVQTELVPNVDYVQEVAGSLRIIKDEVFTQLNVYFSVCPVIAITSSQVDNEIVDRWGEELACGAAAELRLMPGFPWTNPELHDFYHRDLVRGWRDAKRARKEAWDDFQNYTRKRTFY